MTVSKAFCVAILILALGGCAQLQQQPEESADAPTRSAQPWDHHPGLADAVAAVPPVEEPESPYPDDLWARIRNGFGMDGVGHQRTQAEIRYYAGHPLFLDRIAERAEPYLHYVVEQVEERGMPTEIALLPVIESAYQPFAYSHGRAAGLWQFIPGTGRHYGLRQTWWYDGRRDVIASTDAALNYLERLHAMFDGDWHLALAAYNAGEGTIQRAIRRNAAQGRPTDYWSLPLRQETRQYVPRLLAISALVNAPDDYGISFRSISDAPYLQVVDVETQIDLALAADLADLAIDDLYRLNPGYNRWATDPEGPHRLVLPLEHVEPFLENLSQVPADERVRWARHRVEPGQTLSQIARRYNTTVSVLQETNAISGHVIRAGANLIVPVSSQPSARYALSAEQRQQQTRNRNRAGTRVEHQVTSGDTFWELSRKYGVSVRQIAQWNGMAPADTLRPGQTLVVWVPRQGGVQQASRGGPAMGDPVLQRVRYTVRQGDSLYRIAQRFRVSVNDLRRWNNLPAQGYLQPGQQLTMHVDVRAQSGT